jgi:GT2 family glycosyltransferase
MAAGAVAYQKALHMSLAWITVNYHQDAFLREWHDSIATQTKQVRQDIFVVDNSATLDEATTVARILRPNKNLGYFGGFNYCLDRLDTLAYDAIVLSNPDVRFAPDFVAAMLAILDEHAAMILAPRITLDSGVEQNPNIADPPSLTRKLYYRLLFSSYWTFCILGWLSSLRSRAARSPVATECNRQIYMPHGACFIATNEFFRKHKRLDERVFLWGEEAFLRHQVASSGGQIWFVPSMKVTHHEHSATGRIPKRRRFELMRHAYLLYRDLP